MLRNIVMQENLVIVESPAKAKTIEKFLGKDFMVKSSFGHIRDLAKKGLGVSIDNEFEPIYEIPEDKRKVVDELTRLSRFALGQGARFAYRADQAYCFPRDYAARHLGGY